MGGLFSKPKAPTYEPPPPPSAPIEEATFEAGSEKSDTKKKQLKMGKKRLQIPTTTVSTGTGVGGI